MRAEDQKPGALFRSDRMQPFEIDRRKRRRAIKRRYQRDLRLVRRALDVWCSHQNYLRGYEPRAIFHVPNSRRELLKRQKKRAYERDQSEGHQAALSRSYIRRKLALIWIFVALLRFRIFGLMMP